MFIFSKMKTRAATPEEIEMLQADLAKDKRWEQVDLKRGIVGVVTQNDEVVQFVHARLAWQIEPIKFIRGKRKTLNLFQQKKATYMAIRWMKNWLLDVKHNPYIRFYFCVIKNPVMQKLAVSFGMRPLYFGCRFFGEDL